MWDATAPNRKLKETYKTRVIFKFLSKEIRDDCVRETAVGGLLGFFGHSTVRKIPGGGDLNGFRYQTIVSGRVRVRRYRTEEMEFCLCLSLLIVNYEYV